MQVFVILTSFDYEGNDIKAVFSTKKKADEYMSGMALYPNQSCIIEEWEVDFGASVKHHAEPLDKEAEQKEERPAREYDRNETLRKLVE